MGSVEKNHTVSARQKIWSTNDGSKRLQFDNTMLSPSYLALDFTHINILNYAKKHIYLQNEWKSNFHK